MVSKIVTVAVAVFTLPIKSVTVKVTVFTLTFVQLKLVLLNTREAIPQLSVLPLSISLIAILALPVASKYLVTFLVITVGNVVS